MMSGCFRCIAGGCLQRGVGWVRDFRLSSTVELERLARSARTEVLQCRLANNTSHSSICGSDGNARESGQSSTLCTEHSSASYFKGCTGMTEAAEVSNPSEFRTLCRRGLLRQPPNALCLHPHSSTKLAGEHRTSKFCQTKG